MSLWDKIINQNKLDSSLIVELSDISYRSTKGRREQPRGTKEGMVNLGTMPFEETPPQTEITREMIKEYQKEQEKPYIDPATGDKYKYYPSTFKFDVAHLAAPALVNDANLGKPADYNDIQKYTQDFNALIADLQQKEKDFKTEIEKGKAMKEALDLGGVMVGDVLTPFSASYERRLKRDIAAQKALVVALQGDIKALYADAPNIRALIKDA